LRYGVGLHHSELVGLIPQEALIDAAVWYTQLDQFQPDQVLETRLSANQSTTSQPTNLPTTNIPTPSFLDDLAAATPAPGGGCAAAYAGAMGAGLVSMVAGLTIGKKNYAEVEPQMKTILAESESLRAQLTAAVAEDAAAFEAVMQAFKLPRELPNRAEQIDQATLQAARVPLQAAEKAVRVLELAAQVISLGNLNAISDGASGAAMARAALTAAGTNVRINVNSLAEKSLGADLLADLNKLEARAGQFEIEIRQVLETRGGFAF
ncbi:MAG: cyclodeaminase/cyclohydrolase family protein, partial [Chloroflexi bacterium]|nr:cyclodeaminase/cyclohydrolase family protein [Chloroflexota bacterium]